ncbi:MAG: sigma 54-interacting transcriptional regulator, partial [Candidatus Aminicenantes bacterium]|nr:sigma 54-interacting transcriptional regulator [Candidatus Aminicenantes bacterium]
MGVARFGWDDIFGYEEIKLQAKFLASRDVDISIIGETGTGKKLFAEAIHNESRRKEKPFITIETPSIPSHTTETRFIIILLKSGQINFGFPLKPDENYDYRHLDKKVLNL